MEINTIRRQIILDRVSLECPASKMSSSLSHQRPESAHALSVLRDLVAVICTIAAGIETGCWTGCDGSRILITSHPGRCGSELVEFCSVFLERSQFVRSVNDEVGKLTPVYFFRSSSENCEVPSALRPCFMFCNSWYFFDSQPMFVLVRSNVLYRRARRIVKLKRAVE